MRALVGLALRALQIGLAAAAAAAPGDSSPARRHLQAQRPRGAPCTTTGGSVPEGTPCVFPFLFEGVTYNACAQTTGEARLGHPAPAPWCATVPDLGYVDPGALFRTPLFGTPTCR
eukprot:SAG31_NODE_7476_length_1680_cov_1.335231_1_plen_116_part_00